MAKTRLPVLWSPPPVLHSSPVNLSQERSHLPLSQSLPVLVLARTSPGRVGLRNGCRLRVRLLKWRTTITFGGVSLTAQLLATRGLCLWWSALLLPYTASSETTTSIGTMSSSASGSAAGYVTINPTFRVRFLVTVLLLSIINILVSIRLHEHLHDVTNLLLIVIFSGLNCYWNA